MVLLASSYDQSKYFKAVDLGNEKKLRIKSVTEEVVGTDNNKDLKLVVCSRVTSAVWFSIA
jgi:hypothetical protein